MGTDKKEWQSGKVIELALKLSIVHYQLSIINNL